MSGQTLRMRLSTADYSRLAFVAVAVLLTASVPDFVYTSWFAKFLYLVGLPHGDWVVAFPGHVLTLAMQIAVGTAVLLWLTPSRTGSEWQWPHGQAVRLGVALAAAVWVGLWIVGSIYARRNFDGRPLLCGLSLWLGGRIVLRVVQHARQRQASF